MGQPVVEWIKKHIKKSLRSKSETLIKFFKRNMPKKEFEYYSKRDWVFFIGNLVIYNQELKESQNIKQQEQTFKSE